MGQYQPLAAIRHAERWWNSYDPAYPALSDDCTNFVSQVLLAGGLIQVPAAGRHQGWWYRHKKEGWSFSWAVSQALYQFLISSHRAVQHPDPSALQAGDLILYDWSGSGRWRHTAVIVDLDAGRQPLVAAHSRPCWQRPWSYTDSPAYTPACRYAFLQIRSN